MVKRGNGGEVWYKKFGKSPSTQNFYVIATPLGVMFRTLDYDTIYAFKSPFYEDFYKV